MSQKRFHFIGRGPFSKSLLNRALIIKSWYPDFMIYGSSFCEDVLVMEAVVKQLYKFGLNFKIGPGDSKMLSHSKRDKRVINKNLAQKKHIFNCGLSGTAFRFLAARLSREKGKFILKADKSLFKRPLEEVTLFLSQLSVSVEKKKQAYVISSEGWRLQGDCIYIPSKITSQWASALLLNCWNLEHDLYFVFSRSSVSYPYFKMTLDFVKSLGLVVHQSGDEFFVPKKQNLKKTEYHPEQDKSCLFAIACFAVLKGKAVFLNWEEESLQIDHSFPDILKAMGALVELKKNQSGCLYESFDSYSKKIFLSARASNSEISSLFLTKGAEGQSEKLKNTKQSNLIISKCEHLKPLDINLKGCSDLFPMLSVLCAKAKGLSLLRNISHLAFKESNRAQKVKELLQKCGIQAKIQNKDFLIYGQNEWNVKIRPFEFDTENDHRLLMAGELLASMKIPVTLKGKNVVNKSFPEFYSVIESFL